MEEKKPDEKPSRPRLLRSRQAKSFFGFVFLFSAIIIIFLANAFFFKGGFFSGTTNILPWGNNPAGQEGRLVGESDDRINVLVLGVGGQGHDGPYLADTILLASIRPSDNKASVISIPRDLYVPIPGYGWRKINDATALGEAANPGHGEELLAETVSDIFGIPVHYYVRADFEGFEKIINAVGGIDINVENAINDPYLPVPGKESAEPYESRFEHLRIAPGPQHMDGALALKYVRSRHTPGPEGNDFARSRRQQKLLMAFKEKLSSFGFLIQSQKIAEILKILSEHVRTNLNAEEIVRLATMAKEASKGQIISKVLSDGPEGSLYAEIAADGTYVLRPNAGNFGEISEMIKNNILDKN